MSDNKLMSFQLFEKCFKIPLYGKYPSLIRKEFRKKFDLPVSDGGFNGLATVDKYISFKNIKEYDPKKKKDITIDQEIISKDNKYIFGKTNYGIITGKKNGLVVLDLDVFPKPDEVSKGIKSLWETEQNNHPFIKYYCFNLGISPCENWYDTLIKIIKKINTYTVQTPNKGFHLYFKYADDDFRNTQDKNIGVDIRAEGGQIVGCGSQTERGKYTAFLDINVKDLSEIDKDYFYDVYSTTSPGKVNKVLKQKLIKTKNVKDAPRNKSLWKYEMNDDIWEEIEKAIKKKASMFFDSNDKDYLYKNWLKMTTFLKFFDKKVFWETLNNKYSNGLDYYDKNNSTWESIDKNAMDKYDPCICSNILKSLDLYYLLSTIKYRPLLPNNIKPDINVDSEGTKGLAEVFTIEPNINYVIKSRTNSGKTYLVNNYHHSLIKKKPLLSITSRVSLAQEHQRIFVKANTEENDMNYNLYCEGNNRKESLYKYEGENLIIQLDSIDRIENFDFSNYIVFVDELQSVFEYLDTSPTFDKKKIKIQRLFRKILKNCYQFIGVDADIQDTVLEYLNPSKYVKHKSLDSFKIASPNLDFTYVNNEFHPYKDVEADEIYDYNTLAELISKEEQFMVCCDSQTEAHNLKNKIKLITGKSDDDFNIKVIDRLHTGSKDLDEIEQVVFSPAIIYGLDSIKKRKVFCLYKGHTITAKAMLQQVSRCRNIQHLYFHFMDSNNICKPFEFNSPDDVLDRIKYLHGESKKYKINIPDDDDADVSPSELFYNYRMSKHLYNFDSDNTNKKKHFIQGLGNMKIKVLTNGTQKIKQLDNKEKKKLNEKTKEDMLEHFMNNFVNTETPDQYYTRINEILKIPDDKILEYSELFINPMAITQHFNFINIFANKKEESVDKLRDVINENYSVNVVWSDDSKVIWLKNMMDTLSIDLPETGLKIIKNLDKDTAEKEKEKYKKLFRDRSKTLDFTNEKQLTKILVKVITELIGKEDKKNVFIQKKKDLIVDGIRKRFNVYSLNKEFIEYHNTIKKCRTIDNVLLHDYAFDSEEEEEDTEPNPLDYKDWKKFK